MHSVCNSLSDISLNMIYSGSAHDAANYKILYFYNLVVTHSMYISISISHLFFQSSCSEHFIFSQLHNS